MRTFRDLARRKLRTTLTVLGITIGIWALVVFGSMANKINALVEGGSAYYRDKIIVVDRSNASLALGLAPMSLDVADRIAALPNWPRAGRELAPGGALGTGRARSGSSARGDASPSTRHDPPGRLPASAAEP